MGFVKVTDVLSSRVLFDSRREELSEQSNEYIDWLAKRIESSGNEELKSKLLEAAVEREHAEQQERNLGSFLNRPQRKKNV